MSIQLQYLDKYIEEKMTADNADREASHVSSGKLSASMLGKPLQWQILKTIGVPKKELDEYVVRKFKRGNDVEDWLVDIMPNVVEAQKFVEYRDVVGYVDAVVNMDSWNIDVVKGNIPHEVKSVTNAKYKRIVATSEPDDQHVLQACLYGLGLGSEYVCIDYVASDDYRVTTYMIAVAEYKGEIDKIIDDYNSQITSGVLPEFVARYKWQENEKYSDYPEFAGIGGLELQLLLEEKYPEQYKKLQELKK